MGRSRFLTIGFVLGALGCGQNDGPDPIDETPAPAACPTHLDLELIGGESRFAPGWTGSAHGVGPATGSNMSVEITECDAECRRCKFHGPVRGDPAITPVIAQRCLNDVSRVCSINDDCPELTGPCRFVFPPIKSMVLLDTCSIVYFEPVQGPDPSPVQGVIDLVTGESDMPVLNIVAQAAVESCRNCQGDRQPFDGLAEGVCTGPDGGACDVHGIGTELSSQTSFDCPPSGGGFPLPLPGNGTSTADRAWTMDDTRPRCTQAGSTNDRCWCGVCQDNTPCTANRDCAVGTCGAAQSPPPQNLAWNVDNNKCAGTCVWDPATGSGKCSEDSKISCFPDAGSFVARGAAEVRDGFYITQIANLICMPSSNNALIDGIGGFPGPLLFEARFRVTTRSVP